MCGGYKNIHLTKFLIYLTFKLCGALGKWKCSSEVSYSLKRTLKIQYFLSYMSSKPFTSVSKILFKKEKKKAFVA